ncbi:MAG: phosphoglucomutase/phosphomannomutase family protein [Clostridia bacterium]|nr:phosphoglucomutase/phosphomannomutase family protein [Clostridia bacterium]
MIKFGTGGWREVIGDGFTKANVQLVAAAMAKKMHEEKVDKQGFVVGYDRRFLSEQAARWISEVMAAEGILCRVLDKEAPTPLVMFTVMHFDLPYGMAVTASHNPALYNGIKVFTKGGRDATEEVTDDIEQYIAGIKSEDVRALRYETALEQGLIKEIDSQNIYVDSILRGLDVNAIRERHLNVVHDPMFGVSRRAMETVLYECRCNCDTIHAAHDTLFGGRLPAPNEETLFDLKNFVLEHHQDIGIATDGDADRLGIIDENGTYIHANKILTVLYYYLLKYKGWHGPAVRNIATTHILDKIAAAFGENCYEVPVGFKHISAKMQETDAVIGGESSGGLTVRGHIHGKDGVYAASLMLEMLALTKKSLSEVIAEMEDQFGRTSITERNFKFSPERKEKLMDILFEQKKLPTFAKKIERVSYMDGCKVYFENDEWLIARFSGTEPLLRIFCEVNGTQDDANALAETMAAFLDL